MTSASTQKTATGRATWEKLKHWAMTMLTLVFISLYGLALLGWLRPSANLTMAGRLEPIILVIIGYYFGRFSSEQAESALKEEINRHAHMASEAQHAKERALQIRQTLEEKLRNVRTALLSSPGTGEKAPSEEAQKNGGRTRDDCLRFSVATALSIINSQ